MDCYQDDATVTPAKCGGADTMNVHLTGHGECINGFLVKMSQQPLGLKLSMFRLSENQQ